MRFSSGSATALLLAALLHPAVAAAQYPSPAPANQPPAPTPGTSASRPRFAAEAVVQPGEDGVPEVRVVYRLSRTELLFERGPSGYGASYQLRVVFYRARGGRQIAGDAFSRQMRAGSYAETRLRGEDIVDQVSFPRIPAGKYRVRVYLTDLIAERTSGTEFDLEIPERTEERLWLTDLSLGLIEKSAGEAGGERPVPNPSRRYGDGISAFVAYGEIVDRRPTAADTSFSLRWEVTDDLGSRVQKGDTLLLRTGGRTAYRLRPDLSRVPPGSYRFLVELRMSPVPGSKKKRGETLRQTKPFEVEPSRLSPGPESRGSLEVLRYVAEDREAEEMSRLTTEEERIEYWEAFWKRRDPTPDTAQNEARDDFYRRVQYANQHFGVGGAGWKTDMGRVYIRYGPPDEVDRRPFNFDRPPEEIWYYYKNSWTFVFVDRDGFGRYELVQTTAPQ